MSQQVSYPLRVLDIRLTTWDGLQVPCVDQHQLELLFQHIQFRVAHLLDVDHVIPRMIQRQDQLIQLQVDRPRIAVLRVLDQEHHQERHDRRAGIDDELPRVAEAEHGTADPPDDDDQRGNDERDRLAGRARRAVGETREPRRA